MILSEDALDQLNEGLIWGNIGETTDENPKRHRHGTHRSVVKVLGLDYKQIHGLAVDGGLNDV